MYLFFVCVLLVLAVVNYGVCICLHIVAFVELMLHAYDHVYLFVFLVALFLFVIVCL